MTATDLVSIEDIGKWCNGKMLVPGDGTITDLVIDSRKISDPEGALFIALSSNRRDGHSYIQEAYNKGVRHFLVQEELDVHQFEGASFILVKDTLLALQQIAAAYRKQFRIPVIGITGSNGGSVLQPLYLLNLQVCIELLRPGEKLQCVVCAL